MPTGILMTHISAVHSHSLAATQTGPCSLSLYRSLFIALSFPQSLSLTLSLCLTLLGSMHSSLTFPFALFPWALGLGVRQKRVCGRVSNTTQRTKSCSVIFSVNFTILHILDLAWFIFLSADNQSSNLTVKTNCQLIFWLFSWSINPFSEMSMLGKYYIWRTLPSIESNTILYKITVCAE